MTSVEQRLQELIARCRADGGRMTPQRMAILQALLTLDHPTAEEIYARVHAEFPMTSPVTVYRTLAALEHDGELIAVESSDAEAHYDGFRPVLHPHLVCLRCGRMADAPAVDISALMAELARRAEGWELNDEAHFHGLCPACGAGLARKPV